MRRRLAALSLIVTALLSPAGSALERAKGPPLKGEALQRAAESMWRDLDQATWIRDGRSRQVLYVFFDPNCPYCQRVYRQARPRVEAGAVELRWIVVGVTTTTSHGKAAAMLESPDPTAALHQNETDFSLATGGLGGIMEEAVPHAETEARLARNLALLRRSGFDGTPALLFRTKTGEVRFLLGAPPEAKLQAIFDQLE